MLVDAHIHVGDWDHPDFLERGATLDDALQALADAGIAGGVLMPTDQCRNSELIAAARSAVASGAGPLWVVAWAKPGREHADWLDAHGAEVQGVKLHPSLSRVRVDDPGFRDVLEVARRHDLVVLVHCGRWQEIASYRFAIELAKAMPEVRFQLAHAGGDTPPLATAAAEMVLDTGVDNVWFDIAGLREHWVLERNIRKIGAERYLMGSDFSLAHPSMYVGQLAGLDITEAERERIGGKNAAELYRTPIEGPR